MSIVTPPDNAVQELAQYRTLNSKRFLLDTGDHKIIHHLGRVHFQDDDGSLQDIDTNLTTEAGTGDTIADRLPFRFRLLNNGVGYIYQSRAGGTVRVELRRVGGVAIDTNATYQFTRNANRLTFANVATDLDIVIQVNRGGLQIFRVLKSANAAKSWRWAVTYDTDGLSKVDTDIRGIDSSERVLSGLSMTNGTPVDNGNGFFTYLSNETWDGTVKTKDPVTRQLSITSDPQYPVYIDPDVSDHISADNDDGDQYVHAGNAWYAVDFSGKSTWGTTYYASGKHAGFRFQNVAVANGATISLAQLKVNVAGGGSGYGAGTLYGANVDNAAAWSNSNIPTGQSKTAHSTPVTVTTTGVLAIACTNIIQDIINRVGWNSGNSLSLFILKTDTIRFRTTYFWDYAAHNGNEAVLEITLAGGGGGGGPSYTVYSGKRPVAWNGFIFKPVHRLTG